MRAVFKTLWGPVCRIARDRMEHSPFMPSEVKPSIDVLTRDHRIWRWRVLLSTYFGYAGYYLCRKVFSICKTTLADEFSVGLDKIAHIWAAFLVAYMIGQFVCSFVGRKWGPRLLLLGGLGISIAINVAFGFANSYWTFLVFMFFNGLVQASGWPGSVGGVAEWLRKHERGTIMGVWSTSYLVGNLVVKYVGAVLLGQWGWRWSFWGCTLITFVIWWLIYFWQRSKPEDVGLAPIVPAEAGPERTVAAGTSERLTLREYARLAVNPVIFAMGLTYFCIKFLRYSLDSWLPTFLNIMGLNPERASYYSSLFDIGGILPAVLAGWALDRVFRGDWAKVCLIMAIGMIAGYILVLRFEANPAAVAVSFGLVGFMIYGPDTLICGAASVQVAGEKNGVAVAGIVNGIGSLGPVIQEVVIGQLMRKEKALGMHQAHLLGLGLTVLFAILMVVLMMRLRAVPRRREAVM